MESLDRALLMEIASYRLIPVDQLFYLLDRAMLMVSWKHLLPHVSNTRT
jgi:hypothetical protein